MLKKQLNFSQGLDDNIAKAIDVIRQAIPRD